MKQKAEQPLRTRSIFARTSCLSPVLAPSSLEFLKICPYYRSVRKQARLNALQVCSERWNMIFESVESKTLIKILQLSVDTSFCIKAKRTVLSQKLEITFSLGAVLYG